MHHHFFRRAVRSMAVLVLASWFVVHAQSEITVAMGVQSFEGLDPHMQASPPTNAVVLALYDTLVYADSTNQIHPMLATSWEALDDLTWVFHLRDDVKFHDGTAFDSAAVVSTFARVLNPDNALTRRSEFEMVKDVVALDDYTVRFDLAHPSGILLNELAYAGAAIISPSAIETFGKDLALHPVGTGPFRLADMVGGDYIQLERFDDYWDGASELAGIRFVPVSDDATRALMLQTGEADIIANVPASLVPMLQAAPGIKVLTSDTTRVIHIGLNVQHAPLDNQLVRQALNFAVDRDAIVATVLQGLGSPTSSYISPSTWGYWNTDAYTYDPARARALLAEAGFQNGFEVSLWVPSGRYFAGQQVAEAVQGYLADVGVTAKIESVEWGAFIDRILTPLDQGNNTEMYLLGWEASTGEPSVVSKWALATDMWPPAGWNTGFYSNAEFDQLVDEGSVTTDADRRAEIFRRTQEIVSSDAPWIFLYASKSVWGARANLTGIGVLSDETLILRTVGVDTTR